MRNTNTFQSGVFSGPRDEHLNVRPQNTFSSTVFNEAIRNKVNRTKLEPEGAGTEQLFGAEPVSYDKSSQNPMIPKTKSQKVLTKQVPAKSLVEKELYGETIQRHAMNSNKRDGALIAQNVDWKNANQKAIDAEKTQLNSGNLDSKDRKF